MFTCSACKEQVIEVWYSHDLVWCAVCYRKNQREILMSEEHNKLTSETHNEKDK